MNVEQWVEVFRATGLDEAMMHRWHREFEQRYPAQHESFLKWLTLPSDEILKIRKTSQAA
jgi:hypothetical protein